MWCLDCETRRTLQLQTPHKTIDESHDFIDAMCECGYFSWYDLGDELLVYATNIEEEAFAGSAFKSVVFCEDNQVIGSKAFANCKNLMYVEAYGSIQQIEDDAFEGCENLIFYSPRDTALHYLAEKMGYTWYERMY